MKKKLLFILGILVFTMFIVKINAEQSVAITHATEGDEETLLEYNDNMYKLHDGVSYKLYYQLHDRESGYCFYVTTNNGNTDHNYIDCTEQISSAYFDGTFNSNNLNNHEYTFGFVEESTVVNCTKSANYDEEYDRTYTLDGCGDLNIVNTTNVTVENPYNRQNELSIKNVQVEDKYFNYNNEGEAIVTFEGNYYATPLVKGKDYTTKVYFSQSDVGNNINANVNVTLIGEAQNRYRLNGSFADSTGNILPYVIKKDDITVDGNNISINVNGIYLTEGEDYTLTYDQNTYPDKTIVEIRGRNNFASDVVSVELKMVNPDSYVQELIDEILKDEIVVNTKNDNYNTNNSINYKYVVNEILDERIKKDSEHNYFNIKSCSKTNCVINIVRYHEDTDSYYSKNDVNIPIKVVGFVIDDIINASVGDKISINYKFVDENGQEKNVTLKRITPDFQFENKVKIENNKVEVLKKGIIPIYLDLEYEEERYEKKVYILVDFESLINEKINTSSFYANKSKYEYFDSLMYVAEYTFVDELLEDTYIDYTIDTHSVCNSDICDKDAIVDFDFTFYIGNKSFTIKKDDVSVLPIGIVFNHDYNETIDLEVGQTQKIDYTLYSKNAIWSSTNPSVATVDNEGNVTAVGEGASLVIAMVENGIYESIIVRTKPTEGTIKNILNNELNNIFGDNKTFDAKMVSSINEDYKIEYLSSLIYDYIYDRRSSENIVPNIEINLNNKTIDITLGYIYMKLETPDGYYRSVSYCKFENDDDEGFDCNNNSIKLTLEYEDEKEDFDSSLLEKAQNLLNKINFEGEHYSYINDSLEEYMSHMTDFGMYSKIMSKYSDYNKAIKNEDGFTFVLDVRSGDFASGIGFGYIEKDGVIYVSTEDNARITEVIGVKGSPTTPSEKINAIKSVITSKVDESKYKIEITKVDEEEYEDEEIYQIYIIDKDDEEKELYLFAKLVTNYEESNDEPVIDEPLVITHDDIENVEFTGETLTPFVNVYANGTKLMLGADYAVRYENNVYVGTAKVYVTSLNNKFEEFTLEFEIVPSEIKSNVSFDTDGGTIIDSQEVNNGLKVNRPVEPNKDGFEFDGWYTDKTYKTEYDFDSVISKDTVIYVKWIKIVTNIDIKGVVTPKENEKVNLTNLEISTEGIKVKKSNWYKDDANWQSAGAVTTFTGNQKYMLRIELEVMDGFKLSDDFNEDNITVNAEALKVEYVRNGNDIRLYYESDTIPRIGTTPVIKVTDSNDNSILVSWDEIENATSYEVYRSTKSTSGFTKIATVTEVSYLNTGLTYGTTYYYKVKALNSVSNKTSSVVSGKTLPNKVELSISSASTNNVKLEWGKVNVTGYEVYYGTKTSSMSKATTITKNSTLTYNKTGLKTNVTYYFKVRAYKTVSKKKIYGPWSDVVSTKTAPNKPSFTLSIKEYNEHNLNIGESKNATKYVVERSLDGKTYELLEELPEKGVLSQSGELGQTYYYRVKACNAENNCSLWVTGSIKQNIKTPVIKVTNANDNTLLISDYEVEKATSYVIYRSTSKTGKFTEIGKTSETSFISTGLTYGKTYYYKVKAMNDLCSTTSSVVSGKTVPNKVENLTIKSASTNNIVTSWEKVNVTGYELYGSTDNKKWSKVTTITKNSTLTYNKTKLSANKMYYYKVRAYKTVSKKKIYGPWSDVVSTKTAPNKPSFTLSIKEFNEHNLNIGASTGATKYVVEKSLDGKTYELLEELSEKGVLSKEGEMGQTYYYRVKACNAENNCSLWVTASIKQTTKTPTLTLSTTSKKVNVTVSSVDGASGYEIFRATPKKGKYSLVSTLTNEEEILKYVNSTTKGKTYYYKVRAYVQLEDKKVYSSYSSVKSIKSK